MRTGTNDALCFLEFLEQLEIQLKLDLFGEGQKSDMCFKDYWTRLVVIMDNASIHTGEAIKEYFKNWGIMCITQPQYSPQFSPIEYIFRNIKNNLYRIPQPKM